MTIIFLDQLSISRTGSVFPLEDSQYFSDTQVDPAIRKETDGGLIFTRRQYRRDPSRKIVTGWTNISNAHKIMIDELWKNVGGGANSFEYTHPISAEKLQVRFEEVFTTAYKGVGTFQVWDVTAVKLRTI